MNKRNVKGYEEGYWEEHHILKGNLLARGHYINGRKDGEWEYFYDTGELDFLINWSNGLLKGRWISYKKNGDILYQLTYVGESDAKIGYAEFYRHDENVLIKTEYHIR